MSRLVQVRWGDDLVGLSRATLRQTPGGGPSAAEWAVLVDSALSSSVAGIKALFAGVPPRWAASPALNPDRSFTVMGGAGGNDLVADTVSALNAAGGADPVQARHRQHRTALSRWRVGVPTSGFEPEQPAGDGEQTGGLAIRDAAGDDIGWMYAEPPRVKGGNIDLLVFHQVNKAGVDLPVDGMSLAWHGKEGDDIVQDLGDLLGQANSSFGDVALCARSEVHVRTGDNQPVAR